MAEQMNRNNNTETPRYVIAFRVLESWYMFFNCTIVNLVEVT